MKAAIFDLDGTLIDSLWIWEQADTEVLRRHGYVPDDAYYASVSHLNYGQCLDYILSRYPLPMTKEALSAEIYQLAFRHYNEIRSLKPGAKAYLEALHKRGIKLGMATACLRSICEQVLKNCDVFGLFDVIVYSDEIGCNKSNPDIYLRTAALLQTQPSAVVSFEDVPQAVRSAKKAGMVTVGVADSFWKEKVGVLEQEADYFILDFCEKSIAQIPI